MDGIGDYDGSETTFTIDVTEPTSGCTIYYKEGTTALTEKNYTSETTTTKPTKTEGGIYTVQWYVHTENTNYSDVSGSNTISIMGYTVKYNSNGGQGTMTDSIFKKNTESQLKENAFTRECYTFNGWKDQDGNSYSNNAKITPTKDLVLEAQWDSIEYYVNLTMTGSLFYGQSGASNYDTNKTANIETVTLKVYFNKEGFLRTEAAPPINGPLVRDCWETHTMYSIGWKIYDASVTIGNSSLNEDVDIPISITGRMGWGEKGAKKVNRWGNTYTWDTTIKIASNNTVSLSSTNSGVHGSREHWASGSTYRLDSGTVVNDYSMRWEIESITSSFEGW